MPRKYKRKPGVVPRHINWTEDSSTLAFEELNKKQLVSTKYLGFMAYPLEPQEDGVVPRHINWTEDSSTLAFEEPNEKQKSINEISRIYGMSSRTLRRRYEKRNQLLVTQGKYPTLGFENEKRLVSHILKLGDAGFPPERSLICQFAEKLGLKHNFNNETKMAGPQWLKSFLERNPEIVVRQAEGL
ncbi:hypothetical protein JTB14_004426 [Gonioctena quinquepunctata]|nr:hypothetical protein JTB14_004426 [Gonioctena quinquepunctata]